MTSSGTGPFAVEWSVSSPPGGSATPASGAELAPVNSATFATRLVGAGTHVVRVTLTNDCGTLTQDFPVLAEDRRAPDLSLAGRPREHARNRVDAIVQGDLEDLRHIEVAGEQKGLLAKGPHLDTPAAAAFTGILQ